MKCCRRPGPCPLADPDLRVEALVASGRIQLTGAAASIHDTLLDLQGMAGRTPPLCTRLDDEWSTHVHLFEGSGEGPRTVMFHPLAGDTSSWLPVLGMVLADPSAQVAVVDAPGFGETPLSAGGAASDLPRWAASAVTILAAGSPVRVVGHSMGGRLATHAAAAHPELVSDLVLFAPALPQLMNQRLATPFKALGVGIQLCGRLPEKVALPALTLVLHLMTFTPSKTHNPALVLAARGVARRLKTTPDGVQALAGAIQWLLTPAEPLPLPEGATVLLGSRDWLLSKRAHLEAPGCTRVRTGHLVTLEDLETAYQAVMGTTLLPQQRKALPADQDAAVTAAAVTAEA